jgi:predicted transglutaminase-like cysteine proteinase
MMQAARQLSPSARLQAVNRFFNRIPYRSDSAANGGSERWATPIEFLRENAGDCEDYAIGKFFSLRLLGFADRDLRIVAVFDRVQRAGHAILSVTLDGRRHILDSRTDRIYADSPVIDFTPTISMNETDHWRHFQKTKQLVTISNALMFR